jgi:hypothetical protein
MEQGCCWDAREIYGMTAKSGEIIGSFQLDIYAEL